MKLSLDSNVLIYSVDTGDRSKQDHAIDLIRRTIIALGALSEQSLFEFLHVSIRKLAMPREQALQIARGFAAQFTIILPPDDIVDATASVMSAHKLSVWDARLLAVCASAGVDTLLTEDLQDGGRYGSVRVINPFEQANAPLIDNVLPR